MTWEYIAGFVDGEGSFIKCGKGDYRVSIPQTNYEVLEQIRIFTGMGNIWEAKQREAHWKRNWIYGVARQKDTLKFIKTVYPYLIVKRELAGKFIPLVENAVSLQRQHHKRLQKLIKDCKFLRSKGLSYRRIGSKLKVDHGYARRLILDH